MIRLFRKGVYVTSLDIKVITAMSIIKILAVNTGVPWTFREAPYKYQKRMYIRF